MLNAGTLKLDVFHENDFIGVVGAGQDCAARADDLALSDEGEPVFGADSVGGGKKHVVLDAPRRANDIARHFGRLRPVRRDDDQVCAFECERPGALGESHVEADLDADTPKW